jgi:hypothetical protein
MYLLSQFQLDKRSPLGMAVRVSVFLSRHRHILQDKGVELAILLQDT